MKDNVAKMNLQFFADGGADGADTGAGVNGEGVNTGDPSAHDDSKPTYEELVAKLAKADAETQRQKNLTDKASKEAASYKKQLSAEQQAKIEKEAAEKAKDDKIAELEQKMAIIDNTSFWGGKSIGMDEELAKATAEAEATGDKEKFRENIVKHIKAIRDSAYQQALKDRPDPAAGNGNADKNIAANEKAVASAKRMGGVNENILKQYRR